MTALRAISYGIATAFMGSISVGDAPEPRIVQGPELGRVIALPEVGGLHHRYERKAA